MKNKSRRYFLVVALVLIWGIIGHRIYKGMQPDEKIMVLNDTSSYLMPKNNVVLDTFSIHLNYKDPFLKNQRKKVVQKKSRTVKSKKTIVPIQFPSIQYTGLIIPKSSGETPVYLISIKGKAYLFKIGQSNEAVTLLRGNDKEIEISFKEEAKVIKK